MIPLLTSRRLRAGAVLTVLGTAWGAALFPSASPWQASFRLALASGAGVLLPGYLVLRAFGWFPGAESYREKLPIAFGAGYVLVGLLCTVTVVLQLSIWQAMGGLTACTVGLALLPARDPAPRRERPVRPAWWFAVAVLLLVVCAWVMESPIRGEETAELITIRKMVDGPTISLDGVMPEPRVVPTYVVTPYYFFVALMTKMSGLSMFAAYVKLRALYTGLALLALSALAGRLFPALGAPFADLVIPAFGVLFVMDPDPWMWPASMFPLVRRGAVNAGVIAPIFMLATMLYVSRPERAPKPTAEWLAPAGLLFVLLTTHAMEVLYAAFFFAGIVLARLVGGATARWGRIVSFSASCAAMAVTYKIVHERLAAHVYAFDLAAKASALAGMRAELALGLASFSGISEAGRYLIVTSGSVLPYVLIGMLMTPFVARAAAPGGVVLWAAVLLPIAIYSSSKLFVILQVATSTEIMFVFAYFTILGLIAFLAGAYMAGQSLAGGLERRLPRTLSAAKTNLVVVAATAAVAGVTLLVLKLVTAAVLAAPLLLPWTVGIGGVVAVVLVHRRPGSLAVASSTAGRLACLTFVLVIGAGYRANGFIDGFARAALPTQLAGAMAIPSVLDWAQYYPVLLRTTAPTIDLPWPVVEDLTRLLPPRQTLIADPAHSYALPVMLNQYIVNPGHVVSTSLRYFEEYAPLGPDGVRHHPIFNDALGLSDQERSFLREYGVQFILVSPKFQATVGKKLAAEPNAFVPIYEANGFTVYRCEAHR